MAGPLAIIKPALLVWARSSAGLSLDVAASKSAVKGEKLAAWESGSEQPTIAQLRKLASTYKRPLAVFFLPAPPKGWDPMRDFRKLPGAKEQTMTPELRLAIREAWERRDVAVGLASDLEMPPSPFCSITLPNNDPEIVATTIRTMLGIAIEDQRTWKSPDTALARWRAAVEAQSVLVFAFPKVDVKEVRGFSISVAPMPAVAINNNDMPAGRVFTLLHEVAHVVRKSGAVLCASVDDETDVEVFCNHVAGAVLVPRGDLLNEPRVRSATSTEQWTDDALAALSRTYSVSREVLLRRLLILGKTSQTFYAAKRARFAAEYASWNQKRKDGTGGPDYLTTVLSQNGRLYARLVLEAYGHHAITASDVSTYLGVRTQHIPELETGVFMRTG